MGMAERIKSQRILCGYTQEELAEKLGMQKSAIAKYENGRVENIKRSTIQSMASILNCTPSYLMGWDDEENEKFKNEPYAFDDYTAEIAHDMFCNNRVVLEAYNSDFKDRLVEYAKRLMELKNMESETRNDNIVPFPKYPSITNKDIDEFAARNAKKKFTREEIAEMLYIMKEED